MVTNADRLGLDMSDVNAVLLSNGHSDHAGGLAGLAGWRGIRSLPTVVHPLVWTRRRLIMPAKVRTFAIAKQLKVSGLLCSMNCGSCLPIVGDDATWSR